MHENALILPDRRALLERCQREVERARDEHEHAVDRIRRDSIREIERERRALLESFLPVLDDLDRAIAAAETGGDPAVAEGIELVRGRFLGILAGHGVAPFGQPGDRFDPALHDAIARTADDRCRHGHIAEVASRGYRIAGEVLRPAAVTVAWNERDAVARPPAPVEALGAERPRPTPHHLRSRRIPIRRR